MEIGQRVNPQPQRTIRGAVEKMAALATVAGQEVKVVTGHAERAGEDRRPDAYQRTLHVTEVKFALLLRRIDQARPFLRRIDRASPNPRKPPVHTEGVENVVGFAFAVAARLYLGEP